MVFFYMEKIKLKFANELHLNEPFINISLSSNDDI